MERIESVGPEHLRDCARSIRAAGVRIALTDFRCVTDAQLFALSESGLTTYCIDELGGRALRCAAVFNPTVLEHRHQYGRENGPRVFAGPAYFPLAPEYAKRHAKGRAFTGGIRSLVVTMGGVDRSGTTIRVLDALDAWTADVQRHVVLGGAFAWQNEFETYLASAGARWNVHRNPSGLADLCGEADVAITAGGNTLYELASLGTPAIVLHEDPHEAEQGQAFQERGFGCWVGEGTRFDSTALLTALARLEGSDVRNVQSAAGRSIVDGGGAGRICAVVQKALRDSTVQA